MLECLPSIRNAHGSIPSTTQGGKGALESRLVPNHVWTKTGDTFHDLGSKDVILDLSPSKAVRNKLPVFGKCLGLACFVTAAQTG